MNNASPDWLFQLSVFTDVHPGVLVLVLVLVLVAAAVIDYRTFRIPNWLTVGGTFIGLAFSTIHAVRPLDGFLGALGGAGVGLAVLLPLYLLRVMGAGDVKLMAMVGAFLGLSHIVPAILFAFMTGGIAALVFALANKSLVRLAGNIRSIVQGMAFSVIAAQPIGGMAPGASIGKLPYGVSISAGTILYLATRQLGYL